MSLFSAPKERKSLEGKEMKKGIRRGTRTEDKTENRIYVPLI